MLSSTKKKKTKNIVQPKPLKVSLHNLKEYILSRQQKGNYITLQGIGFKPAMKARRQGNF
jgi:hypothetical protein